MVLLVQSALVLLLGLFLSVNVRTRRTNTADEVDHLGAPRHQDDRNDGLPKRRENHYVFNHKEVQTHSGTEAKTTGTACTRTATLFQFCDVGRQAEPRPTTSRDAEDAIPDPTQ